MKKHLRIFTGVVVVLVVILGAGFFFIKSRPVPAMDVGPVEISTMKEGVYFGEYTSGPVSVAVNVLIKNKQIDKIEIVKHQNGLGKKAESIVDEVIKTQSLQVETVSGATYSSKVILKAVEAALNKGKI